MGLINRKNTQTTVSVRMSLQAEVIHYAELLERTPSTLVNDILDEVFASIRTDDPGRPLTIVDVIRKGLGKDAHLKLAEKYHRAVLGLQHPPETERAIDFARTNASSAVPILKAGKQSQQSYDQVRPGLFGCLHAVITQEVGTLYESELMIQAAKEVYDPVAVPARDFFTVMVHTTELYNQVYRLFLKDHLAREIVREIPPHFLPQS